MSDQTAKCGLPVDTFKGYLVAIFNAMSVYPDWRYGQAAFNVLSDFRPELASVVRCTTIDPYYVTKSEDLNDFFRWLKQNW